MKWVSSAGGPLILFPADRLSNWQGAFNKGNALSDYDRACSIVDFIGTLQVGSSTALILNDEPLQTAWCQLNDTCHGYLVRWVYAESESAVVAFLEHLPNSTFSLSTTFFLPTAKTCLLFDSALTGDALRENDYLSIDFSLVKYEVVTEQFQPDSKTSLLVHKFAVAET